MRSSPGTKCLEKRHPKRARPVGYGVIRAFVQRFDDWSDEKATVHYFEQQLEHHRTRIFQEGYLVFLKKHGAHFDEKYLWD